MSDSPFGDPSAPDPITSAAPPRPSWEVAPQTARRPALPAARPAPLPAAAPVRQAVAPPPQYAPPSQYAPATQTGYPPPSLDASPVQYDLAGNALPSSAPAPSPYAQPVAGHAAAYPPPTPYGYAPAPAQAGIWPPQPGGVPYAPRNNSGEQSHLPDEISRLKWNWGAFFFPTMWCRKHGLTSAANALRYGFLAIVLLRMVFRTVNPYVFYGLSIIYAVAYMATRIYFALKGHEMGWRNRHFPGGLDEYFKVQRAWMMWGIGVTVFFQIVLPVIAFVAIIGLGLTAAHHSHNPYGSNAGYGSGHAPRSYGSGYAPNSSGGSDAVPTDGTSSGGAGSGQ